MRFEDIKIDTSKLDDVCLAVKQFENFNQACRLIDYWKTRMSPQMIDSIKKSKILPYGFVGDGWPKKSNQSWSLNRDYMDARFAFHNEDWHCRDVGDAIYQYNFLAPKLEYGKKLRILDIGSGFGRLAIPFFKLFHGCCSYVGVDYSPIGLLSASGFVSQFLGKEYVSSWDIDNKIDEQFFTSLPAWKIDTITKYKFNLFLSIHTMQEMEIDTINFYLRIINDISAQNALFYSVNLEPADKIKLDGWELIVDEPYPINRDGSFNQRLWRKL
jgi:SAM-dependent methyltransferase